MTEDDVYEMAIERGTLKTILCLRERNLSELDYRKTWVQLAAEYYNENSFDRLVEHLVSLYGNTDRDSLVGDQCFRTLLSARPSFHETHLDTLINLCSRLSSELPSERTQEFQDLVAVLQVRKDREEKRIQELKKAGLYHRHKRG